MPFRRASLVRRQETERFLTSLPEAWRTTVLHFQARDTVVSEGDPIEHLRVVQTGWAKLTRHLPDGSARGIAMLGPGSMLVPESGDMYTASATALTDLKVFRIPTDLMRGTLSEGQEFVRQFGRQLVVQLGAAHGLLGILGVTSSERRLGAFLTLVAATCGTGHDGQLEIPMRRDDIAEFLGMRAETVSRRLASLQRRGLIQLMPRSVIRLPDLPQLDSFSSGAHSNDDGRSEDADVSARRATR